MLTLTHVPELAHLQALVCVARRGSMSAAAEDLGISQQATSARVRTAERVLGVAVFARSTRGVRLTAAGQLVVTWAQEVLEAAATLDSGVGALRPHEAMVVRVAASNTVSECLLPRWASHLRATRPDARIRSLPGNSDQVLAAVTEGSVDLGYVECPRVPRTVSSRAVATDTLVVVVAPDHPWARRRRGITADELARTPLITREPGSGTRTTYDLAVPHHAPAALELTSTAAVRDAVVTTGAPTVLSSLAVRQDLETGRLVEVVVTDLTMPRTLRAVWNAGQRPRGPVADLLRISVADG